MLTNPPSAPTDALVQLADDYRLPAPTSILQTANTVTVRFDAPGWVTANGWTDLIQCFLNHLFTGTTLTRDLEAGGEGFVLTAHRRMPS